MGHNSSAASHKYTVTITDKYKVTLTFTGPCIGNISAEYNQQDAMFPSLRSIRRTPSQLHSLQQVPTQHDMLPQHMVYKNELSREYVITLTMNDEIP